MTDPSRKNALYLNSINYFRGISIVFIVAGHCYWVTQWKIDSPVQKTLMNLITGGTIFFVFISGFLFHHIFYKKFDFRRFMTQKVKNVLSPYLIFFLIAICCYSLTPLEWPWKHHFFIEKPGGYYTYARPFLLYLWTGRILNAYWYIPFIMIVFLMSPLFILFINARSALRYAIFLLTLSIPLMIHRPVDNLYVIQSVVYFIPVYLFGILSSIHKEKIYAKLRGKEPVMIALVIVLAIIQAVFFNIQGNFHKPPFKITTIDIMLVQKMVMAVFFMVFLNRFEHRRFAIMEKLAAASFSIYFIHPLIVDLLPRYMMRINPLFSFMPEVFLLAVHTGLLVWFCYLIAKSIKRLFPSKSRMIIGW